MGSLENAFIEQQLKIAFPDCIVQCGNNAGGVFCFTLLHADLNLKVLQFLYDKEDLQFTYLSDLCAVHYPKNEGKELCVVYQLYNLKMNKRICMKVYIPIAKPDIFTACKLFATANWMERETYDFFGVNFVGHPNLIRILNVDEMTYFPLRKEYPLEDGTRLDKDDEMFGR